jgi:AhpD family alkylhydroperoxidase
MQPRIDLTSKTASGAMQAMLTLETFVQRAGLDHRIVGLLKTRVSQINGCAYCIDMHTKDARAAGETEQRLYALNAWRETPFYTERERAALEWAEELTRISESHVPDELYKKTSAHFSEPELIALTLAVVAINGWNRIVKPFRAVPGTYQPAKAAAQPAVAAAR